MADNLDIFICTHKDFKPIVSNSSYKIISQEGLDIIDTNGLELYYETNIEEITNEQLAWSELSRIYYIYKNYNVKDYIGFCHYRRYFDFLDNIDFAIDSLQEYDIICTGISNPELDVYKDWDYFHNINDFEDVCAIAIELYNIDIKTINYFIHSETKYHYNMFVTSKQIFNEYCEFVFTIISNFKKNKKLSDLKSLEKHIIKHYDEYIHSDRYYGNIESQMRLYGFISEYLLQLFIIYRNLTVKECNFIMI